MATINYQDANGEPAALVSDYLLISAGGPDAGRVWLKGSKTVTTATAEQIAIAEKEVPGFAAARAACSKIRG